MAPCVVSAMHDRDKSGRTALQASLGLLTRREHSLKELRRKLAHRGWCESEVELALDRLSKAGWQDDARFAESLVRNRAAAGQGPIRIRAELGTHGLDRDAVAAAMDAFEGDWSGNARDLVRRRYGASVASDHALRRKAADFLIRRGFTADHVRAATRFDPDDPD